MPDPLYACIIIIIITHFNHILLSPWNMYCVFHYFSLSLCLVWKGLKLAKMSRWRKWTNSEAVEEVFIWAGFIFTQDKSSLGSILKIKSLLKTQTGMKREALFTPFSVWIYISMLVIKCLQCCVRFVKHHWKGNSPRVQWCWYGTYTFDGALHKRSGSVSGHLLCLDYSVQELLQTQVGQ